jgi:hypothetical protein
MLSVVDGTEPVELKRGTLGPVGTVELVGKNIAVDVPVMRRCLSLIDGTCLHKLGRKIQE